MDGRLYAVDQAKHENVPVKTVAEADVLYFQCPKCAAGLPRGQDERTGLGYVEGAHYISVPFDAHDGRPALPPQPGFVPRWSVTGKSIDDLTTQPSIQVVGGCAWHGWVTNGEAK